MFGLDLAWLYGILVKIVQWLINPAWSKSISITTIIGLAFNAIQNPQGAVNGFLNNVVNNTVGNLPSTPDQYKIGTLVGEIASTMPFGGGYYVEIMNGIIGMTAIYLGFKSIKMLPFT